MNDSTSIHATLKIVSPSERTLTVTVPQNQVDEAYEKAFQEKRKHLRIKGFRKGNVPDSIAKQYLNDSHLVRRVVNLIVPSAYKEALKIHNLSTLGKPDWELQQSERGKDLVFEARLQVMPILELDQYKKFPIERPAQTISSEQVDQVLYQRQQGAARYVDRPEDHEAVLGDFAFIDYQAKHDGKELPNAAVKNFLLEMNHEKFLPGFVDHLVGIKSGESRTFDLTLPVSYADSKLAGEKVEFLVRVHQLKERQVPDLDDDFVKQFTKLSSLEELRSTIEQNLKTQLERRTEENITNEIVKSLVSLIKPEDVPTQLQEGHARLALRSQTKALERQGLTVEQHLANRGISSEHFGEELSLTGLVEARLEILYRSIAAAENIVVLKKEVDQAIIAQAKGDGESAKLLKQRMIKDDTYKVLAYRLLIAKVRKVLFENADINFVDPDAPQPESKKKKQAAKKKAKSKAKKSKKKASKTKSANKKKSKKAASKAKSAGKKKTKKAKKKKAATKKKNAQKAKSKPKKAKSAKKATTKKKSKAKSATKKPKKSKSKSKKKSKSKSKKKS